MLSFDFDFRSRRPAGQAARAVEQIWFARGTVPYRSELIAPTGSSVLLLILGDPIRETTVTGNSLTSDEGLLIGPHTAPIENAPLGETFALGVVTTSVGCEATTGLGPGGLRGRVVGLDRVGRGLPELRTRLKQRADADPDNLLRMVEAHLSTSLDLDIPGLQRIERAVELLEAEPRSAISDVAREVGVTHAHLDREFNRIVGLTPRALARLLLIRRILDTLDVREPVSWAELAVQNGWSDQSHFSRDFKRHTGVTPNQYLSTQRSVASSGDGSSAGFTPDLGHLR